MAENLIDINDLKNLEYKKINDKEDESDLFTALSKVEADIKSINKNSKKSIMSMELLREDVEQKNNEIFKLQNEIKNKQLNEVKVYKTILSILDQVENVYNFAKQTENKSLLNSLEMVKKIIAKEVGQIDLCEIKPLGELFNPKLHKCIEVVEDEEKLHNEIVTIVEIGYTLRGEVLRPATVIIAK